MRLTSTQLTQLESLLRKRGYGKYALNDAKGYDMQHVFSNEHFQWYKVIEKIQEEDEYGDLTTKSSTTIYLAFWDYNSYPNICIKPFNIGVELMVRVCDSAYYSDFRFPWVHEVQDSIFSNAHKDAYDNIVFKERTPTTEELNSLIDSLEKLGMECTEFYHGKCMPLLHPSLRITT